MNDRKERQRYIESGPLHALGVFLVLYAVWLALSGHFEPFLLIAGAVCCGAIVLLAHRMKVVDYEGYPIHLTWKLPAYWLWLLWQIAKANLDVARRILDPRLPIDPVLARISCTQRTDLGRVIYANSITLTPGTVATDVRGTEIEVHALTRAGLADLRKGTMDAKVSALEGRR